MAIAVYILTLVFFFVGTILMAALTATIWGDEDSSTTECVFSTLVTVALLIGTIVLIANSEKIMAKPEFKHIIKTDTPALIDTTFTKNSDGTCDTTYTYKFKN